MLRRFKNKVVPYLNRGQHGYARLDEDAELQDADSSLHWTRVTRAEVRPMYLADFDFDSPTAKEHIQIAFDAFSSSVERARNGAAYRTMNSSLLALTTRICSSEIVNWTIEDMNDIPVHLLKLMWKFLCHRYVDLRQKTSRRRRRR